MSIWICTARWRPTEPRSDVSWTCWTQNPDDGRGKAAVLNADDPVTAGFADGCPARRRDLRRNQSGRCIGAQRRHHVRRPGGRRHIALGRLGSADPHLRGRWNVANVAAAVACLGSITDNVSAGVARLESFAPVKGRMETIEAGQPLPGDCGLRAHACRAGCVFGGGSHVHPRPGPGGVWQRGGPGR